MFFEQFRQCLRSMGEVTCALPHGHDGPCAFDDADTLVADLLQDQYRKDEAGKPYKLDGKRPRLWLADAQRN